VVVYTGHQHGIEVNLTPPGAHVLLGVPMHEVAGRCVALEDVLGAAGRELPERLAAAPRVGRTLRAPVVSRP
jgi:hypothetical protein